MIFISVYLLHLWLVPSKVLRKMLKWCKNENVHTMWQVPLCWFCSTNLSFVKSPITLGSTVVLESSLDKKEGKKTFVSCKVTSSDGAKLHTEATGNLFWGAAPVWCWQCVSIKSNLDRALLFRTFPAALFVSIGVCKILDGVWRIPNDQSWWPELLRCVWGCVCMLIFYENNSALNFKSFRFYFKKKYYLFEFYSHIINKRQISIYSLFITTLMVLWQCGVRMLLKMHCKLIFLYSFAPLKSTCCLN